MRRSYHIYDCESCILTFAVEQAFEDQSEVTCPVCSRENELVDVGHGEMIETHYPVEEAADHDG